MKKVIFTAILLLVLGTAWMLYLDYDYRRFIERLPSPPAAATPGVEISNIDLTEMTPGPWIEVENTPAVPPPAAEPPEVDPTPHEGTEEQGTEEQGAEERMKFFEKERADITAPPHTENLDSSEDSPDPQGFTKEKSQGLTQEQIEKREQALATLQQVLDRPPDMEIPLEELGNDILNKLSGKPMGPGHLYFHTPHQMEEVLEAIDTLNSNE